MENMQSLIKSSEEDLYLIIGQSIDESIGLNPNELIERAKNWVYNRLPEIKTLICNNKKIKSFSANEVSVELISAIAALLESIISETAATPLAIILSKYGISSFCEEIWLNQSGKND